LDREVPRDHPVAIKVRAALQDLVKRFGGPPAPVTPPAAGPDEGQSPEAVPADEASDESAPEDVAPEAGAP